MKDAELLRLSRDLRKVIGVGYHIVRYSYFYDASSKGHECRYCKLTKQMIKEEKEELLKQLGGTEWEQQIKLL